MRRRLKKRTLEDNELQQKLPGRIKIETGGNVCGEVVSVSVNDQDINTFDSLLHYISTTPRPPNEVVFEVRVPSYLLPEITTSSVEEPTLNEQTKEWASYTASAADSITCHYSNRLVNVLQLRGVTLRRRSSNWRNSRFYCQYKCNTKCCHLNIIFHVNSSLVSGIITSHPHDNTAVPISPAAKELSKEKIAKSFADSLEIIHNELNF